MLHNQGIFSRRVLSSYRHRENEPELQPSDLSKWPRRPIKAEVLFINK